MGMKYFILMTTTINLAIHTIHPMTKHPRKHLVIYKTIAIEKFRQKKKETKIRNKNTVTKKKIGNSKCNIRNTSIKIDVIINLKRLLKK